MVTKVLALVLSAVQPATIDGVTFAKSPANLYVPVKQVAKQLSAPVHYDSDSKALYFGNSSLDLTLSKRLPDGTLMLPASVFRNGETTVNWEAGTQTATIGWKNNSVMIKRGGKSVVVDKSHQKLYAYQGGRLVLVTRVSTGRRGYETPVGSFTAGPVKERMHYSRLYDEAPMPYSVQVNGHIFVHGFSSVPRRPASHGCIRVPIRTAAWFYNWVDIGTPITIKGAWRR